MRMPLVVLLCLGLAASFVGSGLMGDQAAIAAGKAKHNTGGNTNNNSTNNNTSTNAQAQSGIDTARTNLTTAQTALDTLTTKLTTDFEATDDFTAAKKALDDAVAAYDAAKVPVLAALKDKPAYKTAADAVTNAQKDLDALKKSPDATKEQISAAASNVFKLSGATDKLEHEALTADPGVTSTLATLKDARDKLAKLRADFKDSLKTNKDVVAAKQAVDDAQTKLNTALSKH
jgi:chromosome segregation ATPase